jgi:ketosteroid isomerase-like protein
MPASTPEEIPALLAAAMNAGDLDSFLDLHEPGATTIVPPQGRLVGGTAEIRRALEPIFAGAPTIRNEVVGRLEGDGLALIHSRWALEGTGPDDRPFGLAGRGTIVSRRQPDGGWLIVLENTLSPG